MNDQAWHSPPADLQLSEDSIDIWYVRTDIEQDRLDPLFETLSKQEQDRANNFKPEHKFREYVASRGALRQILAKQTGASPQSFKFDYLEHGKPVISENWQGKTISFNLTHSHDITLIAVSLNRDLGIDIEKIREDVDIENLSKRFFSEKEHADLSKYDNANLARAFFACWTRKEAFVKAVGDGIAFGLKEFRVNVDSESDAELLELTGKNDQLQNWSMANISINSEYVAALASRGNPCNIHCWRY